MAGETNIVINPSAELNLGLPWYFGQNVTEVNGGTIGAKCFQLAPNSVLYQYIQSIAGPTTLHISGDLLPPAGYQFEQVKLFLEVAIYYADGTEDDVILPVTNVTPTPGILNGQGVTFYTITGTIQITKSAMVPNIKVALWAKDLPGPGFADNLNLWKDANLAQSPLGALAIKSMISTIFTPIKQILPAYNLAMGIQAIQQPSAAALLCSLVIGKQATLQNNLGLSTARAPVLGDTMVASKLAPIIFTAQNNLGLVAQGIYFWDSSEIDCWLWTDPEPQPGQVYAPNTGGGTISMGSATNVLSGSSCDVTLNPS